MSGPSEYRSTDQLELAKDTMDQASTFGARAETIAEELGTAIKERPYTTLAIAAGLAFAVGALWKLGKRRPPTRLDALRTRLADARSSAARPR
jgi:ElaB/YqjD/DUF883 family membrane-anchored ribosome-binding protein